MTWRVIRLENRRVLLTSIIAVGVVSLIAVIRCQSADHQRLSSAVDCRQVLLVMPDEVRTNGALVFATGLSQSDHQRETITYRAKSKEELEQIQSLKSPSLWRVTGTLQPIIPATNEGQFDSRFYYQQQRIFNELRIKEIDAIQQVKPRGIRQQCHQLRAMLIRYFSTMPQPLTGYCRQLIVGDNTVNNDELTSAVRRLGIIHLFCISGMHIILLVNIIQLVGTYLWLERETLDWLLIIILPLYLIIGGGSTSLVRAVLMMEVSLTHRLLKVDALDGWAISLLLGLAWNPYLLFNLGGQLSYLLSLTLQVLAGDIRPFKQCWLLGLLSLPSILCHVYEFHVLSLVASFVMIPVFSTVIFPLVLISAVIYSLLPWIGSFANTILVIFQRLLNVLASLPGEVSFGKPSLWWALVLFTMTIWLIECESRKRYCQLFTLYLICFTLIHFPLHGEVTFVDIGQGDSIIVKTPFNRRVYLIDTGGKLTFRQPAWAQSNFTSDLAHRATINYLKSQGVNRLDTIYLSHHDADHIGYLPTFLQEMKVKQVVVPAGMEKQAAFLRKVAGCPFNGQVLGVTDQSPAINRELRVLHPFTVGGGKNEDSLVVTGRFGGRLFLFTGDLDRQGELAILAKYPSLRVDVLKLGHHGSRTASDPHFLTQLQVKYAIISAGRFNRYHHPNDEVVDELKQGRISTLSTQQYGMIKYKYYGTHGRWLTKLKGDEIRWTLPNSLNS